MVACAGRIGIKHLVNLFPDTCMVPLALAAVLMTGVLGLPGVVWEDCWHDKTGVENDGSCTLVVQSYMNAAVSCAFCMIFDGPIPIGDVKSAVGD